MKRTEMIPQVILIGGSSSVGKSTVSESLSNTLHLRYLRLRDLSMAADDAELHLLTGEPSQWDEPVEGLVNMIVLRGVALADHLTPAIQEWTNSESRVLFECEGVSPGFSSDMKSRLGALAVFIIETDKGRMHQTLAERSKPFRELEEERRQKVVDVNCQYNEWLRQQALLHSLPCVASQPWDSLYDRMLEAITIAQPGNTTDSASPHG